jgi:hypothetical protein
MVDAVLDSLLNKAVDFYVQAVDYCRISISQIPTPVGTGIWQIKPGSGDVQQMSPDSRDTMPDSGQTGRISGYIAESRPRSGQNAGDPAIWPESWTDPAGSPAFWPGYWPERPDSARTPDHRPSGRDPGWIRLFWPNLRPAGRKLARTAGFRSTGRDPTVLCRIRATLPEFVYAKYKKYFYIILY